ncbi:MAG: tRNA(Ile)-lysidine synthase [Bacteroidia bacterium]|jgi:tRNA(Ile)-lysidine synthase
MQEQLEHFLFSVCGVKKSDQILVAVSGGADSMCLLNLLNKLGWPIEVAHCNFGLRGAESDEDERFVLDFCHKHSVKVHSIRFQTKRFAEANEVGIQEAARDLRYAYFNEIVGHSKNKLRWIATAHNQTDVGETVLINMIRGTGIKGFAGIPVQRGNIIRPLIGFSSKEIRKAMAKNNWVFRSDQSNLSDDYLRNKIRHHLWPSFEELNPTISETLALNANRVKEAVDLHEFLLQDLENKLVTQDKSGELTIPISLLSTYPQPAYVLYCILDKYGYNRAQCDDMTSADSGALFFSNDYEIVKDRDKFIVRMNQARGQAVLNILEVGRYDTALATLIIEIIPTNEVDFSNQQMAHFDADVVQFPIAVRSWEKGDKIQPLGMAGNKLVSDVFIDAKLNQFEKERCLVFESDDQIIWLAGLKQSGFGKVVEGTSMVLRIGVVWN